jgi:hypothetical protein
VSLHISPRDLDDDENIFDQRGKCLGLHSLTYTQSCNSQLNLLELHEEFSPFLNWKMFTEAQRKISD